MVNKIISSLGMLFICMLLSGCTRNDGNIGWLFGEWRLDKMTADDVVLDLYGGEGDDAPLLYTWAFQSDIIRINTILSRHRRKEVFGSWKESGDILELNFSYGDDNGKFLPPKELHLVEGGITRLHIDSHKGDRMVVSHTADDGVTYTYYLTHPL